jgi:hypothetical protein
MITPHGLTVGARPGALLALVVALAAGRASAGSPCGDGTWSLTGAASQYGVDEEVAFREEWRPKIAEIAACLAELSTTQACVEVRGLADRRPFSDATAAALGGQEIAAAYRAEGRAFAVIGALRDLGVGPFRLRQLAPRLDAQQRGVEVHLVRDCLAVPAATTPAEAPTPTPAPAGGPTSVVLMTAPPVEPVSRGRFWLGSGLGGTVLVSDPKSIIDGELSLEVAWTYESAYARLFGAFGLSDTESHRVLGTYGGAVGYRYHDWFEIGPFASHRIASRTATEGWIEQAWAVGVEGSERVWEFAPGSEVLFRQSIAPFGQRWRRAEVVHDGIEAIDTEKSGAVELKMALSFRQQL